ncbi:MAG: class I SAM-dependent rRNA methyltransferase [Myxococcales bacterium]|nr:class I SAM-dependent rRNA methyltransferase [Myxococcales bacterium]
MTTIVLKKGRAKPAWYGHPWIFSEAIARVDGPLEPGDEVRVVDDAGRCLGRGFANPRSQIRVRLATRRDEPLDGAWLARRLVAARELRVRIGLPSDATSAYRLVNSEGDHLPGLIVDVYGDALVVQTTTYAMKRREAEIVAALDTLMKPRSIYEAAAGGVAKLEGFESEAHQLAGEARTRVACRERGFQLEVEPLAGQKTGAYLDQRENRAFVEGIASGARVLDLYSYAGGFAMSAIRGGARSVTAVDVSPRALERAAAHFAMNGLAAPELVESDVFHWLESAPAGAFDLVICDPPKFARARKDLEPALKGYRRLNALAMATLAPGGILCTSSCSQLVGAEEFERAIAGGAHDAHRRAQLVHLSGQPSDHVVPVAFPEGRYLKFAVCRVE